MKSPTAKTRELADTPKCCLQWQSYALDSSAENSTITALA